MRSPIDECRGYADPSHYKLPRHSHMLSAQPVSMGCHCCGKSGCLCDAPRSNGQYPQCCIYRLGGHLQFGR